MSVINKAIATEVALKLTDKKWKEIEVLESELSKEFEEIYLKTVPVEVIEVFKKHPNYFNSQKDCQISGHGFNYRSLSFTRKLPKIGGTIQLKEKDSVSLLKKSNKIDDKIKDARTLFSDIENALILLRSYKKITEIFPEAAPFLPEKITTSLSINIVDIQGRL